MGKEEEDAKLQTASVTFLDGSVNEYKLHRGSYGEVLFTLVSSGMSVEEKDHFSLCFFDNQQVRHWLYNDKKILKQLKGLGWVFSFQVKFYPTVPSTLRDDAAKHMLFLQCREDMKNGKLGASLPTKAALASLIAQADFGDATATAEYEQYVRGCLDGDDLAEKLKELHAQHKGMTVMDAESAYLDECKELSTYGVWQFAAKDSKGADVSIGISAQGITIYRDSIRIHRFTWQSIIKISYRKNQFSVKVKSGEVDKKETVLNYDCGTYEEAKRVWKCGVEHHTFFRLIQPEPKTKGSLFHWGSTPFRFQGRTNFQTKMASQMFDQPTNVVRSPNSARLTHTLDRDEHVDIHSNVDIRDPSSPEAIESPSMEYVIGGSNEKRKNKKKEVGIVLSRQTPTTAHYYHNGQDDVPSTSRAYRAYFEDGRDGRTYLVEDEDRPLEPLDDLPILPLSQYVSVYNGGYYEGRPPQQEGRAQPNEPPPFLPYLNGHSTRLTPIDQLDALPMRYFVRVTHSGSSQPLQLAERCRHEGDEDIVASSSIDTSYYAFSKEPFMENYRIEKENELEPANIDQYCQRYYKSPEEEKEEEDENKRRHRRFLFSRSNGRNESPSDSTPRRQRIVFIRRLDLHRDFTETGTKIRFNKKDESDAEGGAASPSRFGRTYYLSRVRHDGDEEVVEREHIKPENYGITTTSYDGPLEDTLREDDLEHLPIRDHAKMYHHGQSWRIDKEKSPKKEKVIKAPKEKKSKVPKAVAASPEEQQAGKEHIIYIAKVPKDNEDDENAGVASSNEQASREQASSGSRPLFGWLRTSGRPKRADTTDEHADEYYTVAKEKYEGPLSGLDRRDDLENLPLGIRVAQPTHKKDESDAEGGAASPSRFGRTYYLSRVRHDGDEEVVEREHIKPENYGIATTSYDGPLEDTLREDDLEHLPIRDHAKMYHHGQSWRIDKEKSPKKEKVIKAPKEKKSKVPKAVAASPEEQQAGKEHIIYIAKVPKDNEDDENAGVASSNEQASREQASSGSRPLFGWLRTSGRPKRADTTDEHADEYYTVAKEKYEGPLSGLDRRDDLENLPLGIRVAQPTHKKDESDAEGGAASPSRFGRTYYLSRVRHDGDEEVVEREHIKPENYGIATTSYDGPLEDTLREDDLEHLPIRDHAKMYHHGQSWRIDKEKSPKKEKVIKAPKEKKSKVPKAVAASPEEQQAGKEHIIYIAKVPKDNEDDENAGVASSNEQASREQASSGSRPLFGWLRTSGRPKRADTTDEHADEYYTVAKEKYEGPLSGLDRRDDLENLPLGIRVAQPTHKKDESDAEGGAASPSRFGRTYYLSRVRHDGDEEVVEREHIKPENYGIATTSYDGPLEDTLREDDLEHLPIRDHAKMYHHGQSWRIDKEKSPKKEKVIKAPKEKKSKVPKAVAASPEEQQAGKEHIIYIAKVPKDNEDDENAGVASSNEQASREQASSGSRPLFGWLRTSGRPKRADTTDEHADEYYTVAKEKYEGPLSGLDRRDDLENLPLGIRVAQPTHKKDESDAEGGAASPSRFGRTYYLSRVRHDGDEEVVEREHIKPENYGIATTSYDGPLEDTLREDDLEHLPIRDHAKMYHHGQSWRIDKEKSPKKEKVIKAPKEKKSKVPKAVAASPEEQQAGKEHIIYIAKVPKDNEDDENAGVASSNEQASREQASSGSRPLFGWLRTSGRPKRADTTDEHADEYYTVAKEKYEGPLSGLDRRDDLENLPLGIRVAQPTHKKDESDAEGGAASPSRFGRTYYLSRVRHDGDEEVVEREHIKPENYGIATTSYDGPLEDTLREDDLEHLPIRDHAKMYHHGQSWRIDKEKSPKKEKVIKAPKEKKSKVPKAVAASPEEQQAGKEHIIYIAKVPKDNEDDENAGVASSNEQASREQASSGSRPLFGWLRTSGRPKRADTTDEHADEYYTVAKEKYEGPLSGLDRRDDLENLPLGIRVAQPTHKKDESDAEGGAASPSRFGRTYYLSRVRHDGDEEVVEREHIKPENYGIATTSYDGPLEDTLREDDLEHLPIRDHAKMYHHGQSWRIDKEKSPKKEKVIKAPKEKKSKVPKTVAASPEEQQAGKEHIIYIAKVPKDNEDDENAGVASSNEQASREQASSGSRPLFGWLRTSGRPKRADTTDEHADEYYTVAKEKYEGPLSGLDRRDDLENLPLGIRVAQPTHKKDESDAEGGAASPSRFGRTYYLSRVRHDGDEEVVEREHIKPENYGIATTSYDGPLEDTLREDDLEHLPIRDHAKMYHHGQSWRIDKEKSPKKEKVIKAPKEKKSKVPKAVAASPEEQQAGKEHIIYIAKVPKDNEDDENAGVASSNEQASREQASSGSRPLFGWLRTSGRPKRADTTDEHADEYYTVAKEKYEGPLSGLDRRDDLENLPLGIRVAQPTHKKDESDAEGGAASPSRFGRTYYLSRVRHDGDEEVVEREHIKPENYGIATTSYDGPLEDTLREDDLEHLPIRDHAKMYHHGQSWRIDKEKSPKKEKVIKAPKEKKSKVPKAVAASPEEQQAGKEHIIYIAKVPKDNEDDENAGVASSNEQASREQASSGSRPLFGWLRTSGRPKRADTTDEHADEYYTVAKEKYEGPLSGLDRRDDLENLPLGIRVAQPTHKKDESDAEGGAASPSRFGRTYYLSRVRHDGDEDVVEREHIKPENYGIATTSYDGPLEDTLREDDLEHLPIRDHAKMYHHGQSWRIDKEKSPKKEKVIKAPKEKKSKVPKAVAASPEEQQAGKEHIIYIAKVPKDNEDDENAGVASSNEQASREQASSGSRPLFGWLRTSGRPKRADTTDEHADEYYTVAKEKYEGPLSGLDRRDDLENLPLGIRVAQPTHKKDESDAEGGAASPSRFGRTYYLSRVRHDGDEEVVEREHIKPENYGIATTSYDGPLEDTLREDDLEHLPIRDHAKMYHHGQSWRIDKEKSPKKEKVIKAPKEKKSKVPKAVAASPEEQQAGKEHIIYIAKVPKDNEDDENAGVASSNEQASREQASSGSRPLFGWLRTSGRPKRADTTDEHADEYYTVAKEKYEGPLSGLDRRDDLENLPLGIRVAQPTHKKDESDAEGGAASPSRFGRTYYLSRVRHDGDEEVVEREHIKPENYGIATTSYDGPLEDTLREDDLEHLPIRDHAKMYHHGQSWRIDKEKSPKKEKVIKAPKEKKSKVPKAVAASPEEQQAGKEHIIYIAKVPKDNEDDENAGVASSNEQASREQASSGSRPLFGWLRTSGRPKRADTTDEHADEYYTVAKEKYEGPLSGLDRRDDLENLPLGIRVAQPTHKKDESDAEGGAASPSRFGRTYYLSRVRHDGDEDVVEREHIKPENYGIATTSYDGPLEDTLREDDLEHLPIRDHAKMYHHGQSWRIDKEKSPKKEKVIKAPKEKKSKVPKAVAASPEEQQAGKEHIIYIAKVPKDNEDDENAGVASSNEQASREQASSGSRPLFGWLRTSGRPKRADTTDEHADEYYTVAKEKYEGPLSGLDRRDDLENLPLGIRVAQPTHKKDESDAEGGAASPSRFGRTYYLSRVRHDGDEEVVEREHIKPENYGIATTSYDGPLEDTLREDDLEHLPIRDHAKMYHHGQSWRIDKEKSPKKEKVIKAPKEKKSKVPKAVAASPEEQQAGKEHIIYIAKVPKDNEDDENAGVASSNEQASREQASSGSRPLFGWLRTSGRPKRADTTDEHADEYYTVAKEKYEGPLSGLDRRDDLENLPLGIRVAQPTHKKDESDAEGGAASPSRFGRTYYLSRVRHDGDEEVVEREHIKPENYGIATTSYDGPLEDTLREDDLEHLPIRDHAKMYHHGQSWRIDKEKSPKKEKVIKAPKEKKSKVPKTVAASPEEQQAGKEHIIYIAKVPKDNEDDENAGVASSNEQASREQASSGSRPLFGWLRTSGRPKRADTTDEHADEYYTVAKEKYEGPLSGLDRRDDLENLPLGIRVAQPTHKKDESDAEGGAASPSRFGRTYYLSRVRHDGDEEVVEREHIKPENYGIATTSYDGPLEDTLREDDLEHLPIRDHAKMYHHGQSWRIDKEKSPKKEKVIKAPKEKKSKVPKAVAASPEEQQAGKEHIIYIAKVPKDNEDDENAGVASSNEQASREQASSGSRPLFGWLRTSGRPKRADTTDEHADEYYTVAKEKYEGPLSGLDRRDDLENLPLGIRVAQPTHKKDESDAEGGAASPSRFGRTYYLSRVRHDGDEEVVEREHIKPENYGIATTSYDGPLEDTLREDDLEHLPIRDHAKMYHHGQSWRIDKEKSPKKEKVIKAPKEKKSKVPKAVAASPEEQQAGKEHIIYIAKVPKDNEDDENAGVASSNEQASREQASSGSRPLFGWLRTSGRPKRADTTDEHADEYYTVAKEKYEGPLSGLDRRDDLENLPLGIRVAQPTHKKDESDAEGGAASPSRFGRTYYLSRVRHDGDEEVVEREHIKPENYGIATTSYDGPLEDTLREDDLEHLPIRDHAKMYHHGQSWRIDKEKSPKKEKVIKAPKEKKSKVPKAVVASPEEQQAGKEHIIYIAKVPKDNEDDENAGVASSNEQASREQASSGSRPLFGWLRTSGRPKRADTTDEHADEYYTVAKEKYEGPLSGLDRRDDLENLPLGIRVAQPTHKKDESDAEGGAASPSRFGRTYYLSRVRHDGDEEVVEREHIKPENYGIATTSYDGPLEDTLREDDLEHLPIRDHAKMYHHGQSWRIDKEKSPKKEKVIKAPKEKKSKVPKAVAASPEEQQAGKEHIIYIAKVPKDNEDDENAGVASSNEQASREQASSGSRPLFGWLRTSGRPKRADTTDEHADEYYTVAKEKYEGPLSGLDRRDDLENLPLGIRVAQPTHKKDESDAEGGAASPSRFGRTYYLSRVRHDGDEEVVEREHIKPENYGIATTSYDGPLEDTLREDDLEHLPIRDHAKMYHHGQSWRIDKEKSPKKEKVIKAPKEKKSKVPKAVVASPEEQQAGKEHIIYIAKVPKDNEDDENAGVASSNEQASREQASSGSRPLFGWLRTSGRPKRADTTDEHADEYYTVAKEKYEGPLSGLDRRDDLENLPLGIRVAQPTHKKDESDAEGGAASPSRFGRTYYLSRVRHDGDEEVVEREHIKPENYGIATTSYDGPLEDTLREDDLEHLPIRDHAKMYHHGQSWRIDKEKSPKKEKVIKAPKEKKSKVPKAVAASPEEQQAGKEHIIYIAKVPKDNEDDENAGVASSNEQASREQASSGSRPLFGWLRTSGRPKRADTTDEHADEYYTVAKEKYEGPLSGLDRRDDLENLPLGIRVAQPTHKKDESDAEGGAASPSRFGRTYYLSRVRHDGDEEVVEREHIKPENYGIATTSYDGPLEDTLREDDLEHLPIRDHAKMYHHGQSWRIDKEKSPKKEKVIKAPKEKKSKVPKAVAASPEEQQAGKEHIIYIAKVPKDNEDDENAGVASSNEQASREQASSGSRPLFGWLRTSGRPKRADTTDEHADEYYTVAKEKYEGPLSGLDRRDDLENLPLGIRVAQPTHKKDESDAEGGAASPSRFGRTYYLSRVRHDGDEEVVEREHIKPENYGIATTSYDGPLEDTLREDDLEHLPIRDHAKMYHHGQSWRIDKEKSPKKEKVIKAPKEKKSKVPKAVAASPEEQQAGKEHIIYIAKVPKDNEDDENAGVASSNEQASREQASSGSRPLFGWLRTSGRPKRADTTDEHADEYYTVAKEKYEGPLSGLDRRDDLENLPLGIRVAQPTHKKDESDAEGGAASPSRFGRTYYLSRVRHDGDEEVVEREHIKPENYGIATTSYDGPLEDTLREDDLEHLPIRDHAKMYHHGQSWRIDKEKSPKKEKVIKAPKEKKSKVPKAVAASPEEQQAGKEHIIYIAKVPKDNEDDENAGVASSNEQASREQASSGSRPLFGWLRTSGRPKRADTTDEHADEYYTVAKEKYEGPLSGLDRRDDLENLPLNIVSRPVLVEIGNNGLARNVASPRQRNLLRFGRREEMNDGHGYTNGGDVGSPLDYLLPNEDLAHVHIERQEGTSFVSRVEINMERRMEVELEKILVLGTKLSHDSLPHFSFTSPFTPSGIDITSPSSSHSFFSRLLRFKEGKKAKKSKKDTANLSADSSDSSGEVEHEVALRSTNNTNSFTSPSMGQIVREERHSQSYRLTGDGNVPQFTSDDPSLQTTVYRCEVLNSVSPRIAHSECENSIRVSAPLPRHISEVGEPRSTIASWKESREEPEEVIIERDQDGNIITKRVSTKHVSHSSHKHTFQNYAVDGHDDVVGLMEKGHDEYVPSHWEGGNSSGRMDTSTRSIQYTTSTHDSSNNDGMGDLVSSKSVTCGNRTVETLTYKRVLEDGTIETHLEHRVTIQSDAPIDHDAELSAAILEATNMNPDMHVEKIEVRQESTH